MRRTPLKRTQRLRPRTKKRAAQDRQDSATLEAFALENSTCWICGQADSPWKRLEIHHLAGRKHPQRNARANLAKLCSACHETRFTNASGDYMLPLDRLAVALAYKFVHDSEHFDRELVLLIAGYAPTAVTVAELAVLVSLIRKERISP